MKTKKYKLTVCVTKIVRYFDDLDYALDFAARIRKYTGKHIDLETINN